MERKQSKEVISHVRITSAPDVDNHGGEGFSQEQHLDEDGGNNLSRNWSGIQYSLIPRPPEKHLGMRLRITLHYG